VEDGGQGLDFSTSLLYVAESQAKGVDEGSFFLPLSELSDLSNSNFFIFYFLTTKAKTTSLCLKIIKIK
jgi:hypothetical protein